MADPAARESLIQDYLANADLPKLSPYLFYNPLKKQITLGELRKSLHSMASGKAPGPDGLTVAYYRAFQDKLLPHLALFRGQA